MAIAVLGIAAAQTNFHAPTNKYGYYNVLSCPTSPSFFKATTEQNEEDGTYKVYIYHGNYLAQTIKCDVTGGELHFLDANFDGNLDIVVGPVTSRNYSTILLWSDAEQEFLATGIELNGYYLVNPKSKTWVSLGSNGASTTFYQTYKWNGLALDTDELLMVISDKTTRAEYRVNTLYTLIKGNYYYGLETEKNVIKRTDQLKKLPKHWQQIIESFDTMEL